MAAWHLRVANTLHEGWGPRGWWWWRMMSQHLTRLGAGATRFFPVTIMSEADDLYADLYGEEAEPSVSAPPAPKPEAAALAAATPAPSTSVPAATPAAAGAVPETSSAPSFIPGRPAPPPLDSAEARSAAAARGEHIAPQDLPDEG